MLPGVNVVADWCSLVSVNSPCVCVWLFLVPQLIHGGKLDFLVFDYLSEITMSLLTAAKAKMPVSYTCVCVLNINDVHTANLGCIILLRVLLFVL